MNRVFVSCVLTALFCFAASAQTAGASRFEAADVHSSTPSVNIRNSSMQGPFVGGGRFEIRRATVIDLIRFGWKVQADKIVGGPDWTGLNRFDILAQAPAGANAADLRLMLQNLLAERLGLKVHTDTRPMPAFVLTIAQGRKPHLKEAERNGDTGCKAQNSASGEGTGRLMMSGPDGTVTTLSILPGNLIQYNCRNVSMAAFAGAIKEFLGANTGPDPISDPVTV